MRNVWTSVLGNVGTVWKRLGSWRGNDVNTFQRQALPVLLGGQRQVASLTATYLEQLYADMARRQSVDVDMTHVTGQALRGVDPATVYQRPFKEVWTALSQDEPLDVALDRGAHRLDTILKTDLQLTRTHTARDVADQLPGVEYTVRVPIGEYNCALCLIASTQRYHKSELMPIHPSCDCLVKLVTADYDPGQVIDQERLDAVHSAVETALGTHDRSGRAVDYRQIIVSNEHGEIGPVLGFKSHNFSGPGEVGSHTAGSDDGPGMTGEPAAAQVSVSDKLRARLNSARDALPSTKEEWTADRMHWDATVGEWVFTYRGENFGGHKLPPEKYEAHLDTVLDIGRSLYGELSRAMDDDDGLRRLREAFNALSPDDSVDDIRTARKAVALRESAFVHAYISSIREMGGSPAVVLGDVDELGLSGTGVAPGDWELQLKESFRHFPSDWLSAMQDKPLRVVGSERAFYNTGGDIMALSTRNSLTYDGAFSSDAVEVAAHELGHRMEQYIPGLKQLEYTFIRRRAMLGDMLLSPQNMANIQPQYDPAAKEMTYEDKWPDAYTGKTYEMAHEALMSDPAGAPSEVFQVGLQDLYGRGTRKFGDDELQAFMLAILALL
ncbi:hypothetical protein ACWCO0_09760 [Streptomyces tubercidicus]